jgi:hypothetical protein
MRRKPRAEFPEMEDAFPVLIPAAVGALAGAALVVIGRLTAGVPQLGARRVLAYALIASAALYVGLAFASDNVNAWLGIEMTGLAVFGSLGALGIVGSPWWLAAGLVLHPFWHLQFHYLGTGSVFAPEWFTLGLTGFDAIGAAYVVASILFKLDPAFLPKARPESEEAKLTRNERRLAKKLR